jgi:hypothetical protein
MAPGPEYHYQTATCRPSSPKIRPYSKDVRLLDDMCDDSDDDSDTDTADTTIVERGDDSDDDTADFCGLHRLQLRPMYQGEVPAYVTRARDAMLRWTETGEFGHGPGYPLIGLVLKMDDEVMFDRELDLHMALESVAPV